MFKWFKNIGPGALIAAAFIGPGTVTLCTLAGVNYGFALLWAISLSVIATIVLQEMAARVGIITQKGLATVIKNQITSSTFKYIAIALIFIAVVIGNTAYEAGNITGASLGLSAMIEIKSFNFYPIVIGLAAFILLFIGNYKILEKSLIVLVIIMSISFVITAIITKPSIAAIFKGMFIPVIPKKSILTIIGLVGTTVVPYNLFLHASIVKERWKKPTHLKLARTDTVFSVIAGGIVSMAIIIAAAAIPKLNVSSAADLAKGLEPLYGVYATYFMGVGLFASGITSAITAPLAAAYVAGNCFNWKTDLKSTKFRFVWFIVLATGVLLSSLKLNPIQVIKFAQVANGLLLPIIAIFLLWIVNKKAVLGNFKNSTIQNILSIIIITITMVLGVKSIASVISNF